MRVVLLIDSLSAGGAERQIVLLANGLAKNGHEVNLITYRDRPQLIDDIDNQLVQVSHVNKTRQIDVLFFFRLIRTLRRMRPDVLISFLTGPNFWARLCGPFAGPDGIVTSVRNVDIIHSKARILIERLMYRISERIVVNTYSTKSAMEDACRIPEEKFVVIYNGVDTDRFRPSSDDKSMAVRNSLGLNRHDFVILLPGRLELQKNHHCLIRAISQLHEHHDVVKVLFAGNENDPELKQFLTNKIGELGLSDVFRFCGVVQDMAGFYNMSDLVVLPSKWEGLPNVVLEAMACERPVVVSDVADNRYIVEDGVNGFMFNSDDDAELAKKILAAIELSHDERIAMGASARSKIKELCSVPTYIANFDRLISDVGDH